MNKLIFSALFLVFSLNSIAQEKAQQIEAIMKLFHDAELFDGAVLVAQGEQIIHQKAYGFMNRETRTVNTVKTRYRLGALSKPLTAMVVLKLAEQGKIDLQKPVQQYFTELKHAHLELITAHQLLSHTSGLVDYVEQEGFWNEVAPKKLNSSEITKLFLDKKLAFKPGAEYGYSNSNYFLLAMLVEQVTKSSFETVLRDLVLTPAGMKNTGVEYGDQKSFNIANGYQYNTLDPDLYMPNFMGSNQLYSTVEDLYLFDKALKNNTILSQGQRDLMLKPVLNHYACGMGVLDMPQGDKKVQVLTHVGTLSGFSAKYFSIPESQIVIVLLSNNNCPYINRINDLIVKIMNGEEVKLPVVKKRIPVSTNKLKEYIGIYEIEKGLNRKISLQADHLMSVRTDAPKQNLELYCEKEDLFFYGFNNEVTIQFIRNDAGKVVSLVKTQGGTVEKATRVIE